MSVSAFFASSVIFVSKSAVAEGFFTLASLRCSEFLSGEDFLETLVIILMGVVDRLVLDLLSGQRSYFQVLNIDDFHFLHRASVSFIP